MRPGPKVCEMLTQRRFFFFFLKKDEGRTVPLPWIQLLFGYALPGHRTHRIAVSLQRLTWSAQVIFEMSKLVNSSRNAHSTLFLPFIVSKGSCIMVGALVVHLQAHLLAWMFHTSPRV